MQPKNHVDTTKPTEVTHLSLCTGYGGIDLGLARVVSNLRTVAYCEREAAAIELLLSRMEGGQLDAAPIWTDLRSFPWEAFSDRVDILSGATPASHSAQPVSDSEPKTSGTSGQPLQMAFGFCDQESVSSRTSKGTSLLGCEKSLKNWKDSVTARRGEYSARLKLAHHTSESGCSSWPTAKARDWKDTEGCSLDAVNPDGTHRNRRDRLMGAIVAEMRGQAVPANHSTGGSRQESWRTPSSSDGEGGVMEMREGCAGRYKLRDHVVAVQNPQWATPSTGKLNPRWVETLMGLPVGWTMVSCSHPIVFNASAAMMSSAGNVEVTTRTVHAQDQTAVMTDNRTDELRMLGNGVVPATAARAFVTLMEELL